MSTRIQPPDDVDPALAETVRRLYVQPVDAERARQAVATIAEAARTADESSAPGVVATPRRTRGRRVPLLRPALAATAAVLALPVGMAAAGIDVPEPLAAPYRAVGIELDEPERAEPRDRPAPRRSAPARTTVAPTATAPRAITPAAPAPTTPRATPAPKAKQKAKPKPKSNVAPPPTAAPKPKPKPKSTTKPQPSPQPKAAKPAKPPKAAKPQKPDKPANPGKGGKKG